MKKHSFKKSGTNFYKNGAGGGQRPFINFIKNRRFGSGCGPLEGEFWFQFLHALQTSRRRPTKSGQHHQHPSNQNEH